MEMIKRKEIEIEKNSFSYIHSKGLEEDKNIFFFHATGFNAETYIPFYEKLNQLLHHEYSIFALDQRGHGLSKASAKPSDLVSWETFFEDARNFVRFFKMSENIVMGHSMGGVVASRISYDFAKEIKKTVLIDPVLQPQSFKYQIPFFNISNKFFISLLSSFKKNRASEMINNAKKRRFEFSDRDEIFNHYSNRGAFKDWPEEFLKAYINGGTRILEDKVRLSCLPEWEAKTFAVSYAARTKFVTKLKNITYVPFASNGSTFSSEVKKVLMKNPNFIFEEIHGSHFFPMEKKDLICSKISEFITKD